MTMKYYLESFMKKIDQKALINKRDSYDRPAIFYSAYKSILLINSFYR